MARADYHAVEQAIRDTIRNDGSLPAGATVLEEEAVDFIEGAVVVVYLVRREAPAERQVIASGRRLRELLTIEIWIWTTSFGSRTAAAEERDDLIGIVQTIIMGEYANDSKFGRSDIVSFWLSGGEFETALEESATLRLGASIELTVEVATTL